MAWSVADVEKYDALNVTWTLNLDELCVHFGSETLGGPAGSNQMTSGGPKGEPGMESVVARGTPQKAHHLMTVDPLHCLVEVSPIVSIRSLLVSGSCSLQGRTG